MAAAIGNTVKGGNNERFNNNYDFLRIVAATCICFTHSFNLLNKDALEPLMRISGQRYDFSFIGLSIFFTISGYLITRSVYTSSSFLSYLWKRFLRIQPLLILVCILMVVVIGPLFTTLTLQGYFATPQTWTYFRNIFPATGIQFVLPGVFANNYHANSVNGSLWTLIVEERLYLLVGIFFFFKPYKKAFAYLILLANFLVVFKGFLFSQSTQTYLEGSHVFYALLFLNAGALYQLGVDFPALLKNKKAWLGLLVLIISFAVTPMHFLLVLAIPFGVLTVSHIKAPTNRAGQWGDFTYGVYIFAFPVQQMLIACKLFVDSPHTLFAATMTIVFPLAACSWHLLEKRCLNLKKLVA